MTSPAHTAAVSVRRNDKRAVLPAPQIIRKSAPQNNRTTPGLAWSGVVDNTTTRTANKATTVAVPVTIVGLIRMELV